MYIYNVHVNGFSSAVCTKNGTHMTFNVFVSDFWMSVYKMRIMTVKLRFGLGFTVRLGTRNAWRARVRAWRVRVGAVVRACRVLCDQEYGGGGLYIH